MTCFRGIRRNPLRLLSFSYPSAALLDIEVLHQRPDIGLCITIER